MGISTKKSQKYPMYPSFCGYYPTFFLLYPKNFFLLYFLCISVIFDTFLGTVTHFFIYTQTPACLLIGIYRADTFPPFVRMGSISDASSVYTKSSSNKLPLCEYPKVYLAFLTLFSVFSHAPITHVPNHASQKQKCRGIRQSATTFHIIISF